MHPITPQQLHKGTNACCCDLNQVYKPGVGLGFHFDKDEHLLKLTGEMVHPAWSSVLYLTGSLDDSSSSTNTAGSIHMTGRASHGSTDACPAAQQQQRQPADRQPVQLTSTAEFPKSAEVTAAANFKTARELETTGHLEAYGANDDWDGCRQGG